MYQHYIYSSTVAGLTLQRSYFEQTNEFKWIGLIQIAEPPFIGHAQTWLLYTSSALKGTIPVFQDLIFHVTS